jgi:hypothetical protein
MRRRLIIVFVGFVGTIGVKAQWLEFQQLPAPVQATISARKGPDRIKRIQFENRNGISAYEVELDRRGFNPKLVVAPDGSLIEDHRAHVPIPKDASNLKWDLPELGVKKVAWRDLPLAVRKRIDRESHGRPVGRIKSKQDGDQIIFVAEYRQKGANERVFIGEDGSLLVEQVAKNNNAPAALTPAMGGPPGGQNENGTVIK